MFWIFIQISLIEISNDHLIIVYSMEDLFRFIMIRPASTISDQDVIDVEADTELQGEIESITKREEEERNENTNKLKEIKERVRTFTKGENFVSGPGKLILEKQGKEFNEAIESLVEQDLQQISKLIRDIFAANPKDVVQSENFKKDRARIVDSIVSIKMSREVQSPWIHRLSLIFKLYTLIEIVAKTREDSPLWKDKDFVQKHLAASLRLPSYLFPGTKSSQTSMNPNSGLSEKREERQKELRRLGENKTTILRATKQISKLGAESLKASVVETAKPVKPRKIYNGVLQKSLRNLGLSPKDPGKRTKLPRKNKDLQNPQTLNEITINNLEEETKTLLSTLKIDPAVTPHHQIVTQLEQAYALNEQNYREIALIESYVAQQEFRSFSAAGNSKLYWWIKNEAPPLSLAPWPLLPLEVLEEEYVPLPGVPSSHGNIQPIGVMDLLVVKQNLKRYEAGEVAHIENVLQGETRSRKHRRAKSTEEFILEEITTTMEEERDLQSTERFEMKREAEKTIQTDASLNAGLSISGKYGPTVEFKTYVDGTVSNAKEESQKQASTYSKDITDRSSFRVSERVRTERSIRTKEEFEELNEHILDNTQGSKHIIGIYQWVDKVYEAEVYNYGIRTLYDIMIPEPAAFLLDAMKTNLGEIAGLNAPVPFDTPANEITKDNYNDLSAAYGLSGLQPPPEVSKTISKPFSGTSQDPDERDANFPSVSSEISIEEGYRAVWVYVINPHLVGWDESELTVTVGTKSHTFTMDNYIDWNSELNNETDTISINFSPWRTAEFAATVTITIQRSNHAYEEWQNKTHEQILQAFEQRKSEYENELGALENEEGIKIQGRNPLENRSIERNELKKACISLLTHQHFDHFGAIEKGALDYPQLNISEAETEGPYIRFFEQAFEWEQMMYIFYPYFWSQKNKWVEKIHIQDTDPLHAEFLKAGAARVMLPVREGFVAPVAHFMETGETWNGGDVPDDISSPTYVSIINEIKERQADPLKETKHGEDTWEVRLPTTLVKLRQSSDLPEWYKDEEGKWVPKEPE